MDMSLQEYALLSLNDLLLALPQKQVSNIELVDVLQQISTGSDSVASYVMHDDVEVPAFILSADFEPMSELPEERRFCAIFNIDDKPSLALVCDAVEPLRLGKDASVQRLPEPMTAEATPVKYLARHGQQLVFVSDINAMQSYLESTGYWDNFLMAADA